MDSQKADWKREDGGKRDWQNTSTTRWQGSRPSARHQAVAVPWTPTEPIGDVDGDAHRRWEERSGDVHGCRQSP
jgi:hypothetical protein